MRRTVIFAVILLIPVVGLGSAAVVVQPEPERLVEGHTVFAVISNAVDNVSVLNRAAAVAILVRETTVNYDYFRSPGVLWFNDQYVVNPSQGFSQSPTKIRHPCSGAVLAVNRGDPDPRTHGAAAYSATNYVESYRVTDPNNRAWVIDKWLIGGRLVWTSAILGTSAASNVDDDGKTDCPPVSNTAAANNNPPGGYKYPCGGNGDPACQQIQYNGLLFFYLADLDNAGTPKNHTTGSTDYNSDVAGCHEPENTQPTVRNWPCPANDDMREGNSHPYNPQPLQFGGQQRSTHGYSDDCTGDATNDEDCHATRNVDIYYGAAPAPAVRTYRFQDLEGSTAGYHCHQAHSDVMDYCT